MTSKGKDGVDNARGLVNAYRARLLERSGASSEDNLWLFTMTDVMSLLLVCFVMFFIITNKQKAVVGETKKDALQRDIMVETSMPITDELTVALKKDMPVETNEVAITGEIASLIRELNLQDDVTVTAMNKDVVVTMMENVSFTPGAANVLAPSMPVLDNIAEIIKRHPGFMVEIDGHTDNVPIRTALYPSNWELSAARATSVLRYFIAKHDIDPSKLYVKGNADSRPIVPNDTPERKAQNRRVEIRLKEMPS
ncbi:MAG: OmpA family protein [Candidatus Magnetobacterium sp. LHC-1]|uniref:OmpA family protein n=1 Tax=Candidatus Magnetobacterium casense TaxID=1455061 RepID=A0ABS6S084_9BACT|nr:OmpA family protein [Candidatus Magnetobacterium casensis]MBF0608865.1 OmpA family protein [Nitrospirota bacterium]MBV6341799.1 OmpA family protein [Candidatus Magnetobacterium casensis]